MCQATTERATAPTAKNAGRGKSLPMSTQIYRRVVIVYRWWLGLAVFLNFVVFWAVPIGLQGQGWRLNITKRLHPIYTALDNNKWLRSIANTYVYNKEVYSDFFAISCGLAVNTFVTIAVVLYQQVRSSGLLGAALTCIGPWHLA